MCFHSRRSRSLPGTSLRRAGGSLVLLAASVLSLLADPTPVASSDVTASPNFSSSADPHWLTPVPGGTVSTTTAHPATDPFSMLSQGALYRAATTATQTEQIAPATTLSYSTSTLSTDLGSAPGGFDSSTLSQQQKVDLRFAPSPTLSLRGTAWTGQDSLTDRTSSLTQGVSLQTVAPLPGTARLSLEVSRSEVGNSSSAGVPATTTQAEDAAVTQPLGHLPFEAELKAHVEATQTTAAADSVPIPSLEQALVWHPESDATLRLGLRQQQYQAYPGVSPGLNEVMFADWQQHLQSDVSWHSYAEVIDSRDALAAAPLVLTTTGANGTAQQNTALPGSSLVGAPSPFGDNSFTFSTGPSFQLKDDLSANLEYSDRWNQSSFSGGNTGAAEQRVSLSIKGSF